MRVLHGAKVAEPHPDAILCAPGELSLEPGDDEERQDPKALLEELRDELLTEAVENAETEALRSVVELERPDVGVVPAATESDAPQRAPATATELESPARSSERPHPRRLVTLRTRRRGKRRKPT
jgi:hypothetical protein